MRCPEPDEGGEHEPVGIDRYRAATHDVDRLRLVARDRAVGGVVGALTRCDVSGEHGGTGAEQAAVRGGPAGAVGIVQTRVDGLQQEWPDTTDDDSTPRCPSARLLGVVASEAARTPRFARALGKALTLSNRMPHRVRPNA